PFYADLSCTGGIGLDIFCQSLGDIEMKEFRQEIQMLLAGQHFQTGYNGTLDPRFPAFAGEPEISLVIKKHLGYNVIPALVYLVFEHLDIKIKVRRLEMLFRVAGYTHTKVGLLRVNDLLQ